MQAVPVDAVFKVNIVSVNSVHERLHRNFIWKSLKNYPYFEEYRSNLQYVDSLANTYPKLKRILELLINGTIRPKNFANATQTAAIVPV